MTQEQIEASTTNSKLSQESKNTNAAHGLQDHKKLIWPNPRVRLGTVSFEIFPWPLLRIQIAHQISNNPRIRAPQMVRILLITDSTKGCLKCRADFMNQSSYIFGGCGVGALPNLGKRAVDDLPEQ